MTRISSVLISAFKNIESHREQAWRDYLETLTPEEKRRAILTAQAEDDWTPPDYVSPLSAIGGGALGGQRARKGQINE